MVPERGFARGMRFLIKSARLVDGSRGKRQFLHQAQEHRFRYVGVDACVEEIEQRKCSVASIVVSCFPPRENLR